MKIMIEKNIIVFQWIFFGCVPILNSIDERMNLHLFFFLFKHNISVLYLLNNIFLMPICVHVYVLRKQIFRFFFFIKYYDLFIKTLL